MKPYNQAAATRGISESSFSRDLNQTSGILILSGGMNKPAYLGGFVPYEEYFVQSIIYAKNQETAAGRAMAFPDACMRLGNLKDIHFFCGSSQYCNVRVDVNKTTVIPSLHVVVGEEMVVNKQTGKPVISRKTGQPKMKRIWEWQKNVPVKTTANILKPGFENDPIKTGATVQYYIELCKKNNLKYDLILFDPPYSDLFDHEYGTSDYNPLGVEESFVRWLTNECLQILNPNGVLISKNWRSIRHPELQFIAGEATMFGGFRRFTIFEAWQYNVTRPLSYSFEFFENTWLKPRENQLKLVPWFVGTLGSASAQERAIMKKYFDVNRTSNGIVITNTPADRFGNCVPVTMDQFNNMDDSIHDVIIINECNGLGASTAKTNTLKERVIGGLDWPKYLDPESLEILKAREKAGWEEEEEEENESPRSRQMTRIVNRVARDGFIYVKSYFDPNLNFYELELIDRAVITYDNAEKSDLIHIYHKPVGWIVSKNIIEKKSDALYRWDKKQKKK
jgi:hypothetical protein